MKSPHGLDVLQAPSELHDDVAYAQLQASKHHLRIRHGETSMHHVIALRSVHLGEVPTQA